MTITYKFLSLAFLLFVLSGCENDDDVTKTELTGRSVVYQLISGSEFNISGTATFLEKRDSSTRVIIELNGTDGPAYHPVHLHYGAVNKGGDLAAFLYPLKGDTGESITDLKRLADETPVTYTDLLNFDGSIRVHLDDGPNKDVVLSFNNIGKNQTVIASSDTYDIALCKNSF